MAYNSISSTKSRKTRIVCISDTHNQTPKLPKGDVLIHAGDLTNQGSYSELKKTVDWLEKANFEAKVVVAGNHDITLDRAFYADHGSSWRWPKPQDPVQNRKLFEDSPSITYLEHEAATVYLNSPTGPHTVFNVFGSPCTPRMWTWAFQYEAKDASKLWDAIPLDTDIVVTHTPPRGHCDSALKDERSGCEVLRQALSRVRPMLAVCGHIHEARGVERVRWNDTPENGSLEASSEAWKDPGAGNNKQSLVDLTAKGGRPLHNRGATTRHDSLVVLGPDCRMRERGGGSRIDSTSRPHGAPNSEAKVRETAGGATSREHGRAARLDDIGASQPDVESVERHLARRESCVINAALMGARTGRGAKVLNKAIVVDVELPVWGLDQHAE